MALFTISDLHLSLGIDKPMDIFGGVWENYIEKLEKNWRAVIKADDIVVLPGDFCWAMHINESKKDFEFLNALPGIKLLLKGNHDYWWDTVSKIKRFMSENGYTNIDFLHNNSFMYNDVAICGTRFWLYPGTNSFSQDDEKIYLRELARAELSLNDAIKNNPKKIIFFTHYPPVASANSIDEKFVELMKKYGVLDVYYGHLHGSARNSAFVGKYNDINFDLVSCDYLDFVPKMLIE